MYKYRRAGSVLPVYNDVDAYEDGPDDEEDGWAYKVYFEFAPNDDEEFNREIYTDDGLFFNDGWVMNAPVDVNNPSIVDGNSRSYTFAFSWAIPREMAKKVTRDGLIIKANSIALEQDDDNNSGNVPLELLFYPQKGGSTYDKHCVN